MGQNGTDYVSNLQGVEQKYNIIPLSYRHLYSIKIKIEKIVKRCSAGVNMATYYEVKS